MKTLEIMSWEERFNAAWSALCAMEFRAETAEKEAAYLLRFLSMASERVALRQIGAEATSMIPGACEMGDLPVIS